MGLELSTYNSLKFVEPKIAKIGHGYTSRHGRSVHKLIGNVCKSLSPLVHMQPYRTGLLSILNSGAIETFKKIFACFSHVVIHSGIHDLSIPDDRPPPGLIWRNLQKRSVRDYVDNLKRFVHLFRIVAGVEFYFLSVTLPRPWPLGTHVDTEYSKGKPLQFDCDEFPQRLLQVQSLNLQMERTLQNITGFSFLDVSNLCRIPWISRDLLYTDFIHPTRPLAEEIAKQFSRNTVNPNRNAESAFGNTLFTRRPWAKRGAGFFTEFAER